MANADFPEPPFLLERDAGYQLIVIRHVRAHHEHTYLVFEINHPLEAQTERVYLTILTPEWDHSGFITLPEVRHGVSQVT